VTFEPAPIAGAFIVRAEPIEDERGFFARTWCRDEFLRHGLNPALAQCSASYNRRAGTLRGMHWQAAPHAEAKLVRCTRGALFDVIVDLRPGPATRGRWFGLELRAGAPEMLYVPEGCAHGFITLADDTEVFYQISVPYHPAAARGFRWDDPEVAIAWPRAPQVVSPADRALPLLRDA
jgi:dTDP-4-dehydrorhamnose 3,5-epimerase